MALTLVLDWRDRRHLVPTSDSVSDRQQTALAQAQVLAPTTEALPVLADLMLEEGATSPVPSLASMALHSAPVHFSDLSVLMSPRRAALEKVYSSSCSLGSIFSMLSSRESSPLHAYVRRGFLSPNQWHSLSKFQLIHFRYDNGLTSLVPTMLHHGPIWHTGDFNLEHLGSDLPQTSQEDSEGHIPFNQFSDPWQEQQEHMQVKNRQVLGLLDQCP